MNALLFLGVAVGIIIFGVIVIGLTNRTRRPSDEREIENFSAHLASLRRQEGQRARRRVGRR
ncbi:MAG: hypothetical protein GY745_00815 [Actinomycetia bacterium]|nr:hypothetical protein [Actinomycetes bacterium]MCP3913802.1 hypothetical protein [Actinomycetes bacterium]MCP4083589.1 hypothetical protein [Actinomycetes bacterium]